MHAEGVKIVIEAEHCGMLVPHMAKVKDGTASGGWCVAAPSLPASQRHGPEAKPDPGCVAYRVRVPQDGYYRLWARCLWPADGPGYEANSFLVGVGDAQVRVIGQDAAYDAWHWVKGPIRQLTAGEHAIAFRYREPAARLDQLMLTCDMNYVPVRAEAETPQYLVSALKSGPPTAPPAGPVYIVAEAEHYTRLVPSMHLVQGALASGGAFLCSRTAGDDAVPDSGHALYRIKIPRAGEYQVWALCQWSGGSGPSGNSFFLKAEGLPPVVVGQDLSFGRWHWVKGPVVLMPSGETTMAFYHRENNARLDQFALTTKLSFVPSGPMRETPQYLLSQPPP